MDEPWRYYAEWKKSDAKGHICIYDSIYMKFPEQANLQDRKYIIGCQELQVRRMESGNSWWICFFFSWSDENVLKLEWQTIYWKTTELYTLKW